MTTAVGSGNVKEQEPADDGVERLRRAPLPRVALRECEMSGSSIASPLTGHCDHIGGPIDPQNGARGSDELSRDLRNMAQPRAEVEHARPGRETCCPQENAGRTVDYSCLAIESRQLFWVITEDVGALGRRVAFHRYLLQKIAGGGRF